MTFQLSPGVNVSEIDLTGIVPAVPTTDAAVAGPFKWGPLNERVLVENEARLIDRFGKPDNDTASVWFSASNYLQYGNKLRVARVAKETQTVTELTDKLTTTVSSAVVSVEMTGHGLSTGDLATISSVDAAVDGIPASELNGVHTVTVTDANNFTITVTTTATAGASDTGGTFNVGTGDVALNATSEKTTGSGTDGEGFLVKNDEHYEQNYDGGAGNVGPWIAKYPGALGNSLKVSFASSANAYSQTLTVTTSGTAMSGSSQSFLSKITKGSIIIDSSGNERKVTSVTDDDNAVLESAFPSDLSSASVTAKWEYADNVGVKPGTSTHASKRSGSNDEIHIVVIDEDGEFSGGIPNTILEKFTFLSLASDALGEDGESIYYKDVINRKSKYIRWMDKIGAGTNWGNKAASTTFTAVNRPYTFSLAGGRDGNSTAADADYIRGYNLFQDAEVVDVSLIIAGAASSALAIHLINNIAEKRKDCIVFISPEKADVVNNSGSEVTDTVAFRDSLPSSSYAFLDNNWKYQYDRHNDTNRWVPLNGDIAGLAARTDLIRDPWWSFAGLNRGHIKNVIKLAYQPTKAQRDDLYPSGVNPVYTKPGQGTVLFGDRTLLAKPSAFDRVNVRRLFIVIEKAISIASHYLLFEFNNPITRARFVNMVEPYLSDIKGRQGITNFKVVADETNNTPEVIDRNEFIGDIYVKPARSINFIQLNFVAVRTGVEFEEIVLGSNPNL